MNRNNLISVGLTIILLFATGATGVTLVEDARPIAQIVLQAKPSHPAWVAARQLQQYFRRMSDVQLPVVLTDSPPDAPALLVGNSPTVSKLVGHLLNEKHLGYDGFVVKTTDKYVVVAGMDNNFTFDVFAEQGESNGTVFAAFAFLETLGCRFFNASDVGEHIPQLKTIIAADVNIVSKPDFIARQLWLNGGVRPTLTEKGLDAWRWWSVKNRLGGGKFSISHTYGNICPPELIDEHPEYFAYDRKTKKRTAKYQQLCLSNLAVLDRAVSVSRKYFGRQPHAMSASLSPADHSHWCQCEKCRAADHRDPAIGHALRVLQFNNQVAAQLSSEFPDKLFAYYAEYPNMPGPPVTPDGKVVLRAHPAVLPIIVETECLLHDINGKNCPEVTEYLRRVAAWDKVADRLFMRTWYAYDKLPVPVNWTDPPRIQYYHKMGKFLGYSGEIIGLSPDLELTAYVAARLLWDADQHYNQIIDEFFELYFQQAASPMRDYYLALNAVGKEPDLHSCRIPVETWSPKVFDRLDSLLSKAERTDHQDIVTRRLVRERNALRAHRLYAQAKSAYRAGAETDPSSRTTALHNIDKAITFIEQIADQDIIADGMLLHRSGDSLYSMKKHLERLATR